MHFCYYCNVEYVLDEADSLRFAQNISTSQLIIR